MSTVDQWYTVAASNQAASPNGEPEGMQRSGVNDSARERAAGVKGWYDDPGFRNPFADYVFTRITNTQFTLADGSIEGPTTAAGASDVMKVGQRVRMVEGATTWEGVIATLSYAGTPGSGTTTFTVTWSIPNATGPATQPSSALFHDKDIGAAAFSPIGTTTGQLPPEIPSIDDLDPHVLTAESSLNVGQLEGHTSNELEIHASRNRLNINGALDIWQRGASFTAATQPTNAPDNVCADGCTIISDGADRVDITRSTDVPTGIGARYSMRLEAVSTQKFGILVPIEISDAADQTEAGTVERVSASFYAKRDGAATGIEQLRAYLVNIKPATGIPTVTPVSNWQSGSAGVDVTVNALDWEIVASEQITLTDSWQRFTPSNLINVDMDASGAGSGAIALMIHVDDITFAATAAFFLAGLQVNAGGDAMPFIRHPIAYEYQRCQRYCMTMGDDGVALGDGAAVDDGIAALASGTLVVADWRFPVPMFKLPTFVPYGISGGTAGQWYNGAGSIVPTFANRNTKHVEIRGSGASPGTIYTISGYAHANIWGNS